MESEIWEQVSLKTTKGVSAAWMGSISGGPEPGGTAGGMLGWVEGGIFLGPCPDKSMDGLKNKGSLLIQPLPDIDIFSGKWTDKMEWRHQFDHLHLLEEQRGTEKRKTERKEGSNFDAKDQGVKGGWHDQSTRKTWMFSNCQLLYDPARAVFDGME